MKKDDKTLLWAILIMLVILNPVLLFLGVIGITGFVVYVKYKDKIKWDKHMSNIKEKYKNSDKTSNYEVIDTTVEVLDSKLVSEEEWTATKEYKR